MPILATIYPREFAEKLETALSNLLQERLVPLSSENAIGLRIAFLLDIQKLRNLQNPRIKTTSPEGVRVVLSSESGVEVALDFYYQRDGVHFSHCLVGPHLQEFVAAINTLETDYRHRRSVYHVFCIDFHYASHPYLAAFSSRKVNLYTYFQGNLFSLKQSDFKKQLGHLGKTLKPNKQPN